MPQPQVHLRELQISELGQAPTRTAKIERPILCLVVDRQFSRLPIEEAISEAVRGGVDWIQLRDRQLEGKDWLAWASRIAQISRSIRPEVDILVNRRLDVAWAINAAGVHLGFDALGPETARQLLGDRVRIGSSIHDAAEAQAAFSQGLDYIQLAPIFDPLSKKKERPALGLEPLRLASETEIPVIAQGGITPECCQAVLQSGANGIAVTGNVLDSLKPGEATAALRRELDSVWDRTQH